MKVVVKPFLFLRKVLGFTEIELELPVGATVHDLLKVLRDQYGLPEKIELAQGNFMLFDGEQPTGLTILVEGRNIRQLQGLESLLNEGSTVTIFPPSAGG